MTTKKPICGTDAKVFDGTIVSVDGSVEFGPYVRLKLQNGSLWSEISMKPDEATKLSATLAKMAEQVAAANG